MSKIKFIDEVDIKNKKVLLRVDFNISKDSKNNIADDFRIRQTIPTLKYLLQRGNRLTLVSHLGSPKNYDPQLSLKAVVPILKKFLPEYEILLGSASTLKNQTAKQIFLLENIRFYPQEYKNDPVFAKELAGLCDVYVNDGFSVSHRAHASIVGVPKYIPSYGGLLMKREVETIAKIIKDPQKPFVAIVGGAKIESKLDLIYRLTEIADHVLIGGGLANTFLCAYGYEIGKSYCEYEKVTKARKLLFLAGQKHTAVYLPSDVVLEGDTVCKIENIPKGSNILDIGPATRKQFGAIIAKARTIVWNGPLGYFENPLFRGGTDFISQAIAGNKQALSIVGGGDTLAAISQEEDLAQITHISTGGGAMLEFIEKGTLPGLEALKK